MVKNRRKRDLGSVPVAVIAAIIALIGTLSANYMGFIGSSDRLLLDRLKQVEDRQQVERVELMKEIRKYKTEADNLRKTTIILSLEILDLKTKLKSENSRRDLLQSFLDSLDFPAWINTKRESDGRFVMDMINDAYVMTFRVTKKKYEGATDFDVHPYEIAQKYQEANDRVLSTLNPETVIENVEVNGDIIELIVWKFALENDGGEVSIGGFALSTNRIKKLINKK